MPRPESFAPARGKPSFVASCVLLKCATSALVTAGAVEVTALVTVRVVVVVVVTRLNVDAVDDVVVVDVEVEAGVGATITFCTWPMELQNPLSYAVTATSYSFAAEELA